MLEANVEKKGRFVSVTYLEKWAGRKRNASTGKLSGEWLW
jgi:hypothetical protein